MPHFVPFFKVLPLGCHSTAPFCLRLTTTANPSSHSKLPKFLQKLGSGEIGIPPVRIEWSQMCAKSIHLRYLASYQTNGVKSHCRSSTLSVMRFTIGANIDGVEISARMRPPDRYLASVITRLVDEARSMASGFRPRQRQLQ